ncbi:MAG: hypothetical protein Ct9H300mP27_08550 [Chloroflexota bacterium]|nr:MAG: hypothetical protein Ct9H300mP27_08550 [Chloroflexota bacterium]
MSINASHLVVQRTIGKQPIIIETGKLALKGAWVSDSATRRYGRFGPTAVMADKARADIDFLPLTVEFEERLYSAGKIPGSFFRREGRPAAKGDTVL